MTLPRGAGLLTGQPWNNYFILTVCQDLLLLVGPLVIILLTCHPGPISEPASSLGVKQELKKLTKEYPGGPGQWRLMEIKSELRYSRAVSLYLPDAVTL